MIHIRQKYGKFHNALGFTLSNTKFIRKWVQCATMRYGKEFMLFRSGRIVWTQTVGLLHLCVTRVATPKAEVSEDAINYHTWFAFSSLLRMLSQKHLNSGEAREFIIICTVRMIWLSKKGILANVSWHLLYWPIVFCSGGLGMQLQNRQKISHFRNIKSVE